MTIPQPIDTAPMDGTVILSNEGTVKYLTLDEFVQGWYLCDLHGNISRCADDGYEISRAFPTKWVPNALDIFDL